MIKQVVVETENQIKYMMGRDDIKDIIISVDSFSDESIDYFIKKINSLNKNAMLRLERITRKDTVTYGKYLRDENIRGFLVENIDSLNRLLGKTDKIIELDYTMNICNDEAKVMYDSLGKFQYTYPIEISAYDMRKLKMDTLVVYSDLPVMVSANCPFKTLGICEKKQKVGYFTDRKNKNVPYKSYCKYCYSKIFNPDFYYIADLIKTDKDIKNLSFRKLRYEFSIIDDIKKIEKILYAGIDTSEKSKENFTRGHIKKSIQ